jgi:hypothetical protein
MGGRLLEEKEVSSLTSLPFPVRDCVAIGGMVKKVMLNLFQHLIESNTCETLNQVQGDKKGIATQPLKERGRG